MESYYLRILVSLILGSILFLIVNKVLKIKRSKSLITNLLLLLELMGFIAIIFVACMIIQMNKESNNFAGSKQLKSIQMAKKNSNQNEQNKSDSNGKSSNNKNGNTDDKTKQINQINMYIIEVKKFYNNKQYIQCIKYIENKFGENFDKFKYITKDQITELKDLKAKCKIAEKNESTKSNDISSKSNSSKNNDTKNNSSKKKIYSREEAYKIAKDVMKLVSISQKDYDDTTEEPDINKNGELCYHAYVSYMTGAGQPRLDEVYIGSETLNVYSINGDFLRCLK